jgi:hypothetical protein
MRERRSLGETKGTRENTNKTATNQLGCCTNATTGSYHLSRAGYLPSDTVIAAMLQAVLEGKQPKGLSLARIPKLLPLSWVEHRPLLC